LLQPACVFNLLCIVSVDNRIERKEKLRARSVKFQGKEADSTSVSLHLFTYGCAIDLCQYLVCNHSYCCR